MAEFCPRCGSPLEEAQDPARLCEDCGWFGDWQEVLHKPPESDVFNPVRGVLQALTLFRDVCRQELVAEMVYDSGAATEQDIKRVRIAARQCRDSLVQLFTAVRRLDRPPPRVLKVHPQSGMVPWPDDWFDYHYNACNEPCDFLVGPCACGATHLASEEWVREVLLQHNAIIQ
jgi:hypothetical protein